MKRLCLLGMIILYALFLTGCGGCNECGCAPFCSFKQVYLVNEAWPCQINRDVNRWLIGGDRWFLTGKPTNRDYNYHHYIDKNMLATPLDDFTKISTNGNYQLQIVGTQKHNSVTIIGLPASAAYMLKMKVCNGTLSIQQNNPTKKSKLIRYAMNNVIVRVGLRNLKELYQTGNGNVYGRKIFSDGLDIFSASPNNVMLVGVINVYRITKMSEGNITIIGADTHCLDIITDGGLISVSGKVGIRNIQNEGGSIQILGAKSDCLTIYASNSSCTQIVGDLNLQKVTANSRSHVYLLGVRSCRSIVLASDHAEVGLSGMATDLYVKLKGSARFYGKYLQSNNIFITTNNLSHANLNAADGIFATANDTSSIFYFSPTPNVARFVSPSSSIIQIP